MPPSQESTPTKRRRIWRWIAGVALIAVVMILVVGEILVYHAEPILRERVVETLSTRFHSKVELDGFHVSVLDGLEVSGNGLRLFGEEDPNNHEPGIQPLISVAEFRFRTEIGRAHV